MTVETLATQLGLWTQIRNAVEIRSGRAAESMLARLATLPVKRSHATRTLGSYVTRNGHPFCIRLQFAQEPGSLRQTFLHEIAHACDHLTAGPKARRRYSHGPNWRVWAEELGISAERCGASEAVQELHRQRQKLVAVCEQCGAEFHRVRRLNRRRQYIHRDCGGRLRKL